MKKLLQAHALLVFVVAAIVAAWGVGRALLGHREGRVTTGVLGGGAVLVRSASESPAEAGSPRDEVAPRIDRARTPEGIWLHGRVRDAAGGYLGALAFRAASEEEAHVTRTQADGFYEILLERSGPYAITFEPSGGDGLPRAIALSAIVPAEGEETLDLTLPDGSLIGTIATTAEDPVEDARIALYAGPEPEGAPEGEPLATARSDAEGGFRFRLLEPGDYHVFARSPDGTRFARRSLRIESEDVVPRIELRWPE